MHNRLKKAFLVLTAAMVLPAVAGAQTSRVEGMAIPGDYIKDYSGIYTYLNNVPSVGNLVYGELGNFSGGTPFDRSVGAVLGNLWDGRYGTWAIHLREWTPALGQGNSSSPPTGGFDPNFNPYESFDIMWGKKFGTTSLGLRLNRSFGSFETDVTNFESGDLSGFFDPNFNRNVTGYGAGIGFEMGPNASVEGSLLYQSRTFEVSDETAGGVLYEEDGPSTMQLAARMFWQWQPNVLVVPVFKYYTYDLSTSSPNPPPASSIENKWTGWQLGVAGNWTLGSDDLFVLGATMASNKLTFDEDLGFGVTEGTWTQSYSPMVFAALETHVNSWLTLRLGANKGAWYSEKLEDDIAGTEEKLKNSTFDMSLGAGVKLGTLQLDGVLNNAIAQNGLYFISGSTSTPLASKVTATYSF